MMYEIYVTETYTKREHIEVPDDVEDVEGYLDNLCNNGVIDATVGDINFSRHIDYNKEET